MNLEKYCWGVEIECLVDDTSSFADEVDRLDYNSVKQYVHLTHDGSINGDAVGIEVRIGVCTYAQLEVVLPAIHTALLAHGGYVNTSCGLHVHVSRGPARQDLIDPKYIRRLINTWVSIEDVLMATQPESRQHNQYCYRFVRSYLQDGNLENLPDQKRYLISQLSDISRYNVLNLAALAAHGTIECRLHSGTIDPVKILAWVRLLHGIYEYCYSSYNREAVEVLRNKTIGEPKIVDTFKLLGLSAEDSQYFLSRRINKFAYQRLEMAQNAFNKAYDGAKALRRARKAADEACHAVNNLDNERSKRRDQMMNDAREVINHRVDNQLMPLIRKAAAIRDKHQSRLHAIANKIGPMISEAVNYM